MTTQYYWYLSKTMSAMFFLLYNLTLSVCFYVFTGFVALIFLPTCRQRFHQINEQNGQKHYNLKTH